MAVDIAAYSPALIVSAYHPEAIATARNSELKELNPNLVFIRLLLALGEENMAEADLLLARLESEPAEGWPGCQHLTAALYMAARKGDQAAFDEVLERWLATRAKWPGNWSDDILDAAPLAPMLKDFDRSRLALEAPEPPKMTAKERAFVKDEKTLIKAAVAENLKYLQALDITDAPAKIANCYRLSAVNLDLREATLSGDEGYPALIVAFDEKGVMQGSFIAH